MPGQQVTYAEQLIELQYLVGSSDNKFESRKADDDLAALIKASKISADDLKKLQEMLSQFLKIKEGMNIPRKTIRDELALLTGEELKRESGKIRRINSDKIVLHNFKFIEDMHTLIGIAVKCNSPSGTNDDRAKFMELQTAVEEGFASQKTYISAKYVYAYNPTKENYTLLDDVFKAYCLKYSYELNKETKAPGFEHDATLSKLEGAISGSRKEFNSDLEAYFDFSVRPNNELITKLEHEANQQAQLVATRLRDVKRDVEGTLNKVGAQLEQVNADVEEGFQQLGQKLKQFIQLKKSNDSSSNNPSSSSSHSPTSKTQPIQEAKPIFLPPGDNIRIAEIGAGFDEKGSTLKKQILAYNARLKALKNKQAELDTLKAVHLASNKELDALKNSIGLNVGVDLLLEKFDHLMKDFGALNKKIEKFISKPKPCDLLVSFNTTIEAYKDKNAELEKIKDQLKKYQEIQQYLKGKTLNAAQINDRIKHIKDVNKEYWSKAMHVHFAPEVEIGNEFTDILKGYVDAAPVKVALEQAVESPSIFSEFFGYAKVAILGASVGGAVGAISSFSSFNPLSMTTSAGIGAIISGSISLVLYDLWKSEQAIGSDNDLRERFDREMQSVQINKAAYEELHKEVFKLVILVNGLMSGSSIQGLKLRAEFAALIEANKKLNGDLTRATKEELDVAIEAYFLKHLDILINASFDKIYNIHDKEISSANAENSVCKFLKKLVVGEKTYYRKREIITNKIQLVFLETVATLLNRYEDAPGYLNRHPSVLRGLRIFAGICTVGAIATGIVLVVGGTMATAGIGLIVGGVILAIGTYFFATSPYFEYKHGESHRKMLGATSKKMMSEHDRIAESGKGVVETGLTELNQLQSLQGEAAKTLFDKIFTLFTTGSLADKQIGIGALDSWLREYSERYGHSIFIEVDFLGVLEPILLKSARQTNTLQAELALGMMVVVEGLDAGNIATYPTLKAFIEDTKNFLNDQALQATFKTFNIKSKIKEQILEIVSVIPWEPEQPGQPIKQLPEALVTFYIDQLGGSRKDLEITRQLHSIDGIKVAAQELDYDMNENPKAILGGTDTYRDMLGNPGWGSTQYGLCGDNNPAPMHKGNIKTYLQNSLHFLMSLDTTILEGQAIVDLDQEYIHTAKYTIYRTLLIKQLAELTDQTHETFNPEIQKEILDWTEKNLLIEDAKAVFREIQHQGTIAEQEKKLTPSERNKEAQINNKQYEQGLVDAIRVNLTYETKKMTPRNLIEQEMKKNSVIIAPNEPLFGFNKSTVTTLNPQASHDYLKNINKAIADSERFMTKILNNTNLNELKVPNVYIQSTLNDVNQLIKKIDDKQKESRFDQAKFKQQVIDAKTKLSAYQIRLELMRGITAIDQAVPLPVEAVPPLIMDALVEPQEVISPDAVLVFNYQAPTIPQTSFNFFGRDQVAPEPENAEELDDVHKVKKELLMALANPTKNSNNIINFNPNRLKGNQDWKQELIFLIIPKLDVNQRNIFEEVAPIAALD